ncbi:MAG: LytTR family DNA-binding domain-containing protein [Bacteroidota bacterium]
MLISLSIACDYITIYFIYMVFRLLKAPFPKPEFSKQKVIWIVILGLGCSLFILFYNPFEISSQTRDFYLKALIFNLGIIFSACIIFMEWIIPKAFPKAFKNWNIGKALIWYTLVILFTGTIIFLYKSFLGGFSEFGLMDFFYVFGRVVVISFTVAVAVVGISQLFNQKRIATLISGENFQIQTADGKSINISLNDILFATSDDNYVDIHYLENEDRTKVILRSSLKSIEAQIVNPISSIYRCHRQYLINTERFKIVKASSRSMTLILNEYADEIPVSAKYVDTIKQVVR